MPSEPHAPVRGRQLDALRALALFPRGLRHSAYPSAMPVLRELGYAEERAARSRTAGVLWHLTPAGRELLVALGEKPGRED